MSKAKDFDERYRTGELPWDTGRHDKNLELVIKEHSITPCTTLELGAGTGSDAIWLARHGFKVVALDISSTAIEIARKRVSQGDVKVELIVADILKDQIPSGPFDFIFDRGCFHTLDLPEERARLAEIVWNHLNPEGLGVSLSGSTDFFER